MGWSDSYDYGAAQVIQFDGSASSEETFSLFPDDSIHILSGLGGAGFLTPSIRHILRQGSHIGFYLEPWENNVPFKGILLQLRYRLLLRRLQKIGAFFLSTSKSGERQLLRLGVSPESIYSFAYFLSDSSSAGSVEISKPNHDLNERNIRLLFIGSLIPRKNVERLMACADKFATRLSLTVVGSGPLSDVVDDSVKKSLGTITRIDSIQNSQVPDLIRSHDFLVLPSIHDGWGAVVSESLLEGTPVLVSGNCGSSRVVIDELHGFVFAPHAEGVESSFMWAMERGPVSKDERYAIQEWASRSLSARVGAQYLIAILQHHFCSKPRPLAPWGEPPFLGLDSSPK